VGIGRRGGCHADGDCPGTTCRSHICLVVCQSDSDCPDPQRCCGPAGEKACVVVGDEVCDGKDNDCDGVIDDHLESSDLPLCDKQLGVCAGSRWACVQGLLQPCDDAWYASYSADYEPTETRCDGKDNDCNGQTDELASCAIDAGAAAGPDAAQAQSVDSGSVSAPGPDAGRTDLAYYGCDGCSARGAVVLPAALLILLAMGWPRGRRRRRDR
jgi:hypothetical protein